MLMLTVSGLTFQHLTLFIFLEQRGQVLPYGKRQDLTPSAFRMQAPFQTNDLFEHDGECWRFLSRRSERIKVAGYWVSPQELEAFLLADARVAKAVAVPVETQEGLTRLRAFIVLADPRARGDVVAQDLMDRMRGGLRPKALRPDRIEVVADLSSTPTGKIRRQEVRAQVAAMGRSGFHSIS